jgi:hypothetical protein
VDKGTGDIVVPLSSLVGAADDFDVGVGVLLLWIDTLSILSLSPLFDEGPDFSFPTPTAPRKRL